MCSENILALSCYSFLYAAIHMLTIWWVITLIIIKMCVNLQLPSYLIIFSLILYRLIRQLQFPLSNTCLWQTGNKSSLFRKLFVIAVQTATVLATVLQPGSVIFDQ